LSAIHQLFAINRGSLPLPFPL